MGCVQGQAWCFCDGPALLRDRVLVKISRWHSVLITGGGDTHPFRTGETAPTAVGPDAATSSSSKPLAACYDEALGGGASLAGLYCYLNLCEAILALRPASRAVAEAARACPRFLNGPLSVEPQDVEDLMVFLRSSSQVCRTDCRNAIARAGPQREAVAKIGLLLRAAAAVMARRLPSATPIGRRLCAATGSPLQRLALPFGLPNTTLRAWASEGLLAGLEELHLLGRGGPSDAGLTYIARYCPNLQ
ncbi:unnamed protein product, partial [Polarella glacialis]